MDKFSIKFVTLKLVLLKTRLSALVYMNGGSTWYYSFLVFSKTQWSAFCSTGKGAC